MAEAAPEVYDIVHPTPVSLKELSAMTISVQLWRSKLNEYRKNGKMEEFKSYMALRDYSLIKLFMEERNKDRFHPDEIQKGCYPWTGWAKFILPTLPLTIYQTIEKFFTRFMNSMEWWLKEHYKRVFSFCKYHQNDVLEYFDDFVCDYDGSVHYVRTAERMMRCERLTTMMKFIVACTYFFEDDIERFWPSVSRCMNLDCIDFHKLPQLYYSICRFTNKLDKIPTRGNGTVDETMFRLYMPYNRPSVEYFWNRIPLERQMQSAASLYRAEFVRFILPKLDERQLYEFVNSGDEFYVVFRVLHSGEEVAILRTWSYIKNIMNERTFTHLVCKLIEIDEWDWDEDPDPDWNEKIDREKWECLCSELWKDTPLNLKQSVTRFISSESRWLEGIQIPHDYASNQIHVEFLLLILQAATPEERNSFWHNCWRTLIKVIRTKALQQMMLLCFKNEDEITQFKQNFMINSPVVLQVCFSLFKKTYFDELNAFVSFCGPDLQAARNIKEQILRSVFLSGDCPLSREIVNGVKGFKNFVQDVSTDFKNRLMSSPSFTERLLSIICNEEISLKKLTEFIDTLGSTEEALTQMKMSLIDSLKDYVTTSVRCNRLFNKKEFDSILLWCLGSNEAVEEFKLAYLLSFSRLK